MTHMKGSLIQYHPTVFCLASEFDDSRSLIPGKQAQILIPSLSTQVTSCLWSLGCRRSNKDLDRTSRKENTKNGMKMKKRQKEIS